MIGAPCAAHSTLPHAHETGIIVIFSVRAALGRLIPFVEEFLHGRDGTMILGNAAMKRRSRAG